MGPFSQCLLYRPQEGGSWAADPETFFMETQRYPRHSARPWRRPSSSWITGGTGPPGSALDAGTTDLCWIEIKDRDLLLRAGLFSPGNLGRLQIRRRLPLLPPGALPLSGSEAAQLTHFLLAALQVYYRGTPGGHFRRPPVSPCGLLPSPWHSRALKGRGARSADRAPRSFQYGHRITFPHWKGFGMFSPLDRNICLVYYNTYVRFQGRETPWA